jgi:hypothetical protein
MEINKKEKTNKIYPLLRQPWSNFQEWKACYDLLFNNSYGAKTNTKINRIEESLDTFVAGLNVDNLINARNVLNIWLIRNDCTNHPLITNLLLEEIIKVKEGKFNIKPDCNSFYYNDVKNILSQKIIRVTNLLIDDLKKKNRNLNSNMFLVAKEIELPEFIVEIRHSCTHKDLPSINTLLFVIKYLFFWIKENIWDTQYNLYVKESELTDKTISLIKYLEGNFKIKTFESKLYEIESLITDYHISFEIESLFKIVENFVNVMLVKILITNNAVLCENLKEFSKVLKLLVSLENGVISLMFFKYFSDQVYFLISRILSDDSNSHLLKEKESILKKFAFIANFVVQNGSSTTDFRKEDFQRLIRNIYDNLSFCREFSNYIQDIFSYFNLCFKLKIDSDLKATTTSFKINLSEWDEDLSDEENSMSEDLKKQKTSNHFNTSPGSLLFEQLDNLLGKPSNTRNNRKNNPVEINKNGKKQGENNKINNEKSSNMNGDIQNINENTLEFYNYIDLDYGLIL